MRVITTKNINVESIKMLVFGKSGAGKTTLAGTTNEPTLILSAESGLLSLKNKDCDVIELNTDDLGRVIPKEQRTDRLMEVYKWLTTDPAAKKYKWIVLDSITEISQNLVEKLNVKYPEQSKKLNLWGDYALEIRGIIKAFRDLPNVNVLFTCLATEERDDNGKLEIGIDMSGKIKQQIQQFFDLVLYLHIKKTEDGENKHLLLCNDVESVPSVKDRSSNLSKNEEADLSLIASKIRVEQNG